MKKLILLLLVVSFWSSAQDIMVLKHSNYTSYYSRSKKYPVMVEWKTTKAMVGCPTPLKRKDNFKPDPQAVAETNLAADYVKSGYDRGHVMPAADNLCQTPQIQDECFYFSNMLAQTHRLNAGDWKSLEVATRNWAQLAPEIRVWAGGIGEIKKIGSTSVPAQCYKVILIGGTDKWYAYLFNNDESKPDGYENNAVDKSIIEKLTGLKFAK